jgi:hypothetical protein
LAAHGKSGKVEERFEVKVCLKTRARKQERSFSPACYCSQCVPYCSHLTYPFVLPWSLLEAITTGSTVVASNTAPVEEFLSEGPRSRLVDFFDVEQLKMAAIEMLGRDKENLHVRPIEGREKKPIGSVESALLAHRKLFGIQKYTQGKNSVYQPLNSKINCNAPRPHAKNTTRKVCRPIREDRTPNLDSGK